MLTSSHIFQNDLCNNAVHRTVIRTVGTGRGGRGAFLEEKVQLKYGLKFRGVDLTHCPPVPTALVIKLLHIKSDSFLTSDHPLQL